MPATCPTGSIQSFPLKLGFTPTESDYSQPTVQESISIDVNWAPRTAAPTFDTNEPSGYTDEGSSQLSNQTTLRYNGRKYTLLSVQVCEATHTNWVVPTVDTSINNYDVIVTFQSSIDTIDKYVMLVMPLLSTGALDPNYLTGLVGTADTNATFSVKDCFPEPNANFVMYSTCLIPTQANTTYKNMDVFVCYDGTQITTTLQEALKAALPTGAPYISTVDSGLTRRLSTLANQGDFGKKIMTTACLLNPKGCSQVTEGFTDASGSNLSAFKCVPFDPDTQIKGGAIVLDTTTGLPLTQIDAARQAMRDERTGRIPPTSLKIIEYSIAVILAITGIGILCYIGFLLLGRSSVAGAAGIAGAAAAPIPRSPFPIWIIIGLIVLVLTFMSGVLAVTYIKV